MRTSCSVDGCERLAVARTYCHKHWQRWNTGRPLTTNGLFDRFLSFIDTSQDCWNWTGTIAGRYGQFTIFKQKMPAHRAMYELFVGPVAAKLVVCHRCDNPLCVNPEHLFLGTQSDNMLDMVSKGRHAKHVTSYRKKLSIDQVVLIRASKATAESLGRQYCVDPVTILHIRKGRTWIKKLAEFDAAQGEKV